MRKRPTTDKLKGNHQAEPKSRKPEDTNLGDIKEPKTIDGENTSPRNELARTAPNPVGTPSLPRSSRPPKITQKDGTACECDDLSLRETFGTSDTDLRERLFVQIVAATPNRLDGDDRDHNDVLAALHSINPRDSIEGMLSSQMVVGHNLAMTFFERVAFKGQTEMGVDLNLNRATKLQRTFIAQMEALNRYRDKGGDKGAHKMIVEEVHVYDRGQAIVGPVSHQTAVAVPKEEEGEDDGKSNR